jgi:plastocyanin
MRTFARLLPLGLVAAVLSVPMTAQPAQAETVSVRINSYSFQPILALVAQGTTVRWRNEDQDLHNIVSVQGFWRSPDLELGDTYSRTQVFLSAGTYPYVCTRHPGDDEQPGETGAVRVRLKAPSTASGPFTLRWSSLSSTPTNRSFDVEKRAPGSSRWVALKTGTTSRSMSLSPVRTGTWSYRARTNRVIAGVSSGWSPVKSVTVS